MIHIVLMTMTEILNSFTKIKLVHGGKV